MKKIILTLSIMLASVYMYAQSNEPTVEFDMYRNLYRVSTGDGNYHHVTEDGLITGPFKFTSNNVVIKGNMFQGKRHGIVTTLINNEPDVIVKYEMGKAITYTKVLR